jgi:hypothetical protein
MLRRPKRSKNEAVAPEEEEEEEVEEISFFLVSLHFNSICTSFNPLRRGHLRYFLPTSTSQFPDSQLELYCPLHLMQKSVRHNIYTCLFYSFFTWY